MRIGYAPNSHGSQRTRGPTSVPFYAERRGLSFELADASEGYDLVVVTPRADLAVWSRYRPGRSKVIFDIVDSYLDIPRTDPKALLRVPQSS